MDSYLKLYKEALAPIRELAIFHINAMIPFGYCLQLSTETPDDLSCMVEFIDEVCSILPSVIDNGETYGIWRIRREPEGIQMDGISQEDSAYSTVFNLRELGTYDLCEILDFIKEYDIKAAETSPHSITFHN